MKKVKFEEVKVMQTFMFHNNMFMKVDDNGFCCPPGDDWKANALWLSGDNLGKVCFFDEIAEVQVWDF